jgi:hypothetical protein
MKLDFQPEKPNFKNRHEGKPMVSLEYRLKSKVDVDPVTGCWNWTGSFRKSGYGKLNVGSLTDGSRHTVTASRASYETFVGPIPEGLVICHKCDNPKCINPEHLFTGTFKDNYDDMVAKGRVNKARGSRIGISKLTESQVIQIRKSRKSLAQLATVYGVTENTIRRILNRELWKHV